MGELCTYFGEDGEGAKSQDREEGDDAHFGWWCGVERRGIEEGIGRWVMRMVMREGRMGEGEDFISVDALSTLVVGNKVKEETRYHYQMKCL
jgi:hypothetical protein